MNDTLLWVFIGIGFVAGVALTLAAVFNFAKARKVKSFDHIVLHVQAMFVIANLLFLMYALGISILSYNDGRFWNSAPTWIGNFIPLILNIALIIGKIKTNNTKKHSNSAIQ
ncbi:MAG: hypothetical protein LBT17_02385 [Mycoplasmataceae bacterium]|jgi:uncharacterized protein with PQ loop repeat|nr:hypothetical protein [Mycoplasmataceae bacterium]